MHTRRTLRSGFIRRIVLAAALGTVTTLSVAWGSAALVPLGDRGGTVGLDGDHLQPWLIRLEHATGERIIWFEKGRIYSKPGVGPPGGSSAAVSNWSFATNTRRNPKFSKAEVKLCPEVARLAERGSGLWGFAVERRGWPFPAMECRFIGSMDPKAESIYQPEHGSAIEPETATTPQQPNLANLRAIPLRPIWPGLAADVALLGLAWFALLWLVGTTSVAARGARRAARGRCPSCGYDLRHDLASGCPECGWRRPAPVEQPS